MRQRLALQFPMLLGAALLAACVTREVPHPPSPPATPAQVEKEMQYLQQSFLTDACMARLRRSAPELTAKDKPTGKAIYAVEFPPGVLATDGRTYRLQVTERDRLAYLYTSGGGAGWYTVHGPLPLWQCMHRGLQ